MYEYRFVRIEIKPVMWISKIGKEYQKIINSYAKNGWRFKQIFAPSFTEQGAASYIELIFEKEI